MTTVVMGLGQFQRFLSCDLGTGLHTCDLGTRLHGALMIELMAFSKEKTHDLSLCHSKKAVICKPVRETSLDTTSASTLILVFLAFRSGRIKLLLINKYHPVYGVLLEGSTLTQTTPVLINIYFTAFPLNLYKNIDIIKRFLWANK